MGIKKWQESASKDSWKGKFSWFCIVDLGVDPKGDYSAHKVLQLKVKIQNTPDPRGI